MDPLRQGSKVLSSTTAPTSMGAVTFILEHFPPSSTSLDNSNVLLSSPSSPISSLPDSHDAFNSSNPSNSSEEFQLEAVREPYLTLVVVLFASTSIISVIFNIVALILINSRSNRACESSNSHLQQNRPRASIPMPHYHTQQVHHSGSSHSNSLHPPTAGVESASQQHQQQHTAKLGRRSTKRTTTGGSSHLRFYLVNLFVNDILIALLSTPFTYTDYLYGQWLFPPFLCPVSNFISICAVTVSVYTLIAIGLERYLAVVFPFKLLTDFKRYTKRIISLVWIIGITMGIPALLVNRAMPFSFHGQTLLDCRENWENEMNSKIYTIVLFVATFVIPLICLAFLYSSIARVYFRHEIPGNADAIRDQIQLRTKTKLYRMLILLVIAFTICWLPIQTYNMIMWVCTSCQTIFAQAGWFGWFVFVTLVCQWLSIAHTFLDPIIYFFNSRNFNIRQICYELKYFPPIRFVTQQLSRLATSFGLTTPKHRNASLKSCRFTRSSERRSSLDVTFCSHAIEPNITRCSIAQHSLHNKPSESSILMPTSSPNKTKRDPQVLIEQARQINEPGKENTMTNCHALSDRYSKAEMSSDKKRERFKLIAVSSIDSSQACSRLSSATIIRSKTISNILDMADI